MKIISLVPSITETLFDFGLSSHEIIGRTKFCIHPKDKVLNVEKIGGTKNLHIERIKELNPELIIANKEENTKEQVEELMKHHEVWVTDIADFKDNITFITDLGNRLNKKNLAKDFNQKMQEILYKNRLSTPLKVAYLIWRNPYMTIGGDTYISDILTQLGFQNIFQESKRYPEIGLENLASADYIFLSSEPYPFQEKHIREIKDKLPHSKIILVDGEVFSWYGTHLLQYEKYLETLIHSLSF